MSTMKTKDDGGPAFPLQVPAGYFLDNSAGGMSLRDWFAGQALNGLLRGPIGVTLEPFEDVVRAIVNSSFAVANAMLEERKK